MRRFNRTKAYMNWYQGLLTRILLALMLAAIGMHSGPYAFHGAVYC